ncbi:MAG TPA: hypothetical protein VLK33_11330 [Terriglobales bacterium]|nr:hypothetical protein [Terriglobales bacterium]
MTSQLRPYLVVAVAIAAVVLLGTPTSIFAQKGNETGLPLYPNPNTGTQYTANPEGYAIYTCQSPDTLATVEEWYRHALPKAKETQENNQLTHGIVLTNGKDKVLVYQLGKSPKAVIELQKYVR